MRGAERRLSEGDRDESRGQEEVVIQEPIAITTSSDSDVNMTLFKSEDTAVLTSVIGERTPLTESR